MGRRTLVILMGAFVAAASLGLASCGDDPAVASPRDDLLQRGIQALWGNVDPAAPLVFHSRSDVFERADDATPAYSLSFWAGPNGAYREERLHARFGIAEVYGLADLGAEPWARIDATVVPLSEEEAALRRLQPLLFEISKLAPLADEDRFEVTHVGSGRLTDGTAVESLRVESMDVDGLALTMDFDQATALVRRVRLDRDGAELPESLHLSDYRSIEGVQVAFRVEGRRGEDAHSIEIRREADFEVDVDAARFACPLDVNRDAVLEKPSIGGHWAFVKHEGSPEKLDGSIRKLKQWVAECKLRVDGPLVVHWPVRGTSSKADDEEAQQPTVLIAVRPPATEIALEPESPFGLCEVKPRASYCLTSAGDEPTPDLLARIDAQMAGDGRKAAADAYEVFFSPDRKTRQVQVPVRVE